MVLNVLVNSFHVVPKSAFETERLRANFALAILHITVAKFDMLLQAAIFFESTGADVTLVVSSLYVDVVDVVQKSSLVSKRLGT